MDLLFDVGSHLGNRVAHLHSYFQHTVAMEPDPMLFRFLRSRFGKKSGVTILNKGLGRAPETKSFYINSFDPSINTFSGSDWQDSMNNALRRNLVWDKQIQMELITLDELITKYGTPDFCKIDVEGYELEVLRGLSTPIPMICFEFLSFDLQTVKECLQTLLKLGQYGFQLSIAQNHHFELMEWTSHEEILDNLEIKVAKSQRVFSGDVYAKLKDA